MINLNKKDSQRKDGNLMATFGEMFNVEVEQKETETTGKTFGDMFNVERGPNRNRKVTIRRYDIVGYKHNGGRNKDGSLDKRFKDTITEFKGVSARFANEMRAALRKDGYYRVDKIEVTSFARGSDYLNKEIIFSEKEYAPALVGRIPGPIEMSEAKVMLQRNIAHSKIVNAFARNNKSTETRTDSQNIIIFEKISGEAVYYGSEEGAVFFILNAPLSIENYVLYVNQETYERLAK